MTNPFAPHSFSVSPDSHLIAAAGVDAYAPDELRDRLVFWDVNARKQLDLVPGAARDASCVSFAQHHPLVVIGYMGGEVRVWNYKTGNRVADFGDQHQRIWSAIFSPDDRWVVAGGFDGTVVFYDWRREITYRPPADTSWWVLGLAFSPDGRTLASAESDGTVRLWNVFSRRCALELRGHAGPVSKVAFSPDGNLLASCGGDGTVRLWTPPVSRSPVFLESLNPKMSR